MNMRYSLQKERQYLFSPAAMISLKLDISGTSDAAEVRRAIKDALKANELMNTHIVISADGEAYFETMDEPCCPIEVTDCEWRQALENSERRPFDLAEGELARFYIVRGAPMRLLICAHRLIGDGGTLIRLAGDIMAALSGAHVSQRPIALCKPDKLPGSLPISVQLNTRMMNLRWQFAKRAFDFRDLKRLSDMYPVRDAILLRRSVNCIGPTVPDVCALSAAALMSVPGGADYGVVVVNGGDVARMGDYSSELVIGRKYDDARDVDANAAALRKELDLLCADPGTLNYNAKYLHALAPTLIDAAYFAAYDEYGDPIARRLSQMRGLSGRARRVELHSPSCALLNSDFDGYRVDDCTLIPPLSPGARRSVGVARLGNRVTLTLRASGSENQQAERDALDAVATAIA